MSGKHYGSGGCGCGGGGAKSIISVSDGSIPRNSKVARTGHHARARAASQGAKGGGGCGCGSGGCGGSCGGSCSCGGGESSCGCNPGVLVQPSFFAGQLLTDDDLQALTNYVVTKQRLHNRFLIGSGVACGLAVTCHPCGGGKVIVQPGYAVDCCGNEILVPCAVELDINAMVRELKLAQQGQDCGDPCAQPTPDRGSRAGAATNAAGTAANPNSPNEPEVLVEKPRGKRYCIYLEYCEEPTDLVAPYTQDDSCSVTCQPSRLREGFRFELRCPTEDPEPPSFVDRLRCCIGDLGEADKRSADFERAQLYARKSQVALAAHKAGAAPRFIDDDAIVLIDAQKKFGDAATEFMVTRAARAAATGDTKPLDEAALRVALDEVRAVGAATARFHLMSAAERKKALEKHAGLAEAMEQNRELLQKHGPTLAGEAEKVLSSPLERTLARSMVSDAVKYSDPQLSATERSTKAAYFHAYDSAYAAAAGQQLNDALASFKSWLLRKIDECPPTGQCCLTAEIEAIRIPTGEELTEETTAAAEKLVRAFIRYLLDCICSALLPPCPTCDDSGVKLACVTVYDCEVCEICNLERTFLLTESNLRYWLPFLHGFGEALEKLCCEFAGRFRIRDDSRRLPDGASIDTAALELRKQSNYFRTGAQLGNTAASMELFPHIARVTGVDLGAARSALNLGGNMARLTARDPMITSMAARFTDLDAGRESGARLIGQALDSAPAREAIRQETEKAVASRIKEATGEIDKRQAKVIKDLQAQNEELNKRLVALEKRKTP
ncbi:MAG: hypothetical protein K0Q92_1374 [Steroidobacteraceae bacterium]|nr:hypothetical protein [Steroidobacteraceae bacterium]